MSEYQHIQTDSIIEVRTFRFNGPASCVYHLQMLTKRIFRGVSDGPMEVRLSLRNLKEERVIKTRSSRRLPKNQSLWIGFGGITEGMVGRIIRSNPSKLVLGPNIDIHNSNVRELFDEIPKSIFVVPSLWVQNYYVKYLQMDRDRVRIWTAGIDLEKWKPTEVNRDSVLIYVKGDFIEYASQIEIVVQEFGYKSSIIVYGQYSQTEFFESLNRSKFAIFLIGTESQGIAQFQSWSMDVPTLVLRQTKYRPAHLENADVLASSSPYLSVSTGRYFDSPHDMNSIRAFLEDIDSFSPRFWVECNHSLSISSENFVNLFR